MQSVHGFKSLSYTHYNRWKITQQNTILNSIAIPLGQEIVRGII
jgi:hypothetical protein